MRNYYKRTHSVADLSNVWVQFQSNSVSSNAFVSFILVEILQNSTGKSAVGAMANRCSANCWKFVCSAQKMRNTSNKRPSKVRPIQYAVHSQTCAVRNEASVQNEHNDRIGISINIVHLSSSECISKWNRAAGLQFLRLGLSLFEQEVSDKMFSL